MAGQDVERLGAHTDTSSESSESLESYSERVSLLPPDVESRGSNYKSTEITTSAEAVSSEGGEGDVNEIENGNENGNGNDNDNGKTNSKHLISILSLLLIGVFISSADGTLVMATYTTISSEFGAFGNAAWLTTSYSLASCAMQPIVGKLSDIYGRKPVLITSYAIFAVGSVLTGLSQSIWQTVAARIISGASSAGMTVIVSVLITDLVPLIQVAAWRSYVNVFSTLGRSIGGPLGGWLADTIGWRWSFMGQGPLMVLAITLVALKLPARSSTDLGSPQKGQPSKLRRIDFIGAFMLAVTIVSFLLALSLGGQNLPWSHPLVIGLIVGAVLLGCIFVTYEVEYAFEPIFPPSLAIKRDVATPYAVIALQTSAQLAMMFSVPLYFRVTSDASNTAAGAHLFPAVLGNTVGGLLSGFVIQRTGRYKLLTVMATISSSITYALLIFRWRGKISLLESLEIIPGGFGTGVASASTFIALTSSIKHTQMAVATGGMYLSTAVGMLFGLAVSSSVQVGTLRKLLGERLLGPGSKEIIAKVTSNVSSIRDLEAGVKEVVLEAYVKSLEYSHMVSLGCSLLALLIALTIREHALK